MDEWSALMDVDNETQKIGLATTHTDICHFPNRLDDNYRILIRQLEMFVRLTLPDTAMKGMSSFDGRDPWATHAKVNS